MRIAFGIAKHVSHKISGKQNIGSGKSRLARMGKWGGEDLGQWSVQLRGMETSGDKFTSENMTPVEFGQAWIHDIGMNTQQKILVICLLPQNYFLLKPNRLPTRLQRTFWQKNRLNYRC
ncbi:hypothetical protein [Erwinia sp.]|uniref:hypothetical protein n=1 Tax=Erwinia citreus TaxID=558 RepID=UPI00289B71C8|nr:hypothetical protein [Erwinia sp.]